MRGFQTSTEWVYRFPQTRMNGIRYNTHAQNRNPRTSYSWPSRDVKRCSFNKQETESKNRDRWIAEGAHELHKEKCSSSEGLRQTPLPRPLFCYLLPLSEPSFTEGTSSTGLGLRKRFWVISSKTPALQTCFVRSWNMYPARFW